MIFGFQNFAKTKRVQSDAAEAVRAAKSMNPVFFRVIREVLT
jgi:hypothetical protein